MVDGRIPKDLLYGKLELGSRRVGRPKLRLKDVCKRDMLVIGLPTNNSWESLAVDRSKWKSLCSKALRGGEKQLNAEADKKRARRKGWCRGPSHVSTSLLYVCEVCNRKLSFYNGPGKSRWEVHQQSKMNVATLSASHGLLVRRLPNNVCGRKASENACEQVTIGFAFASHRFRKRSCT